MSGYEFEDENVFDDDVADDWEEALNEMEEEAAAAEAKAAAAAAPKAAKPKRGAGGAEEVEASAEDDEDATDEQRRAKAELAAQAAAAADIAHMLGGDAARDTPLVDERPQSAEELAAFRERLVAKLTAKSDHLNYSGAPVYFAKALLVSKAFDMASLEALRAKIADKLAANVAAAETTAATEKTAAATAPAAPARKTQRAQEASDLMGNIEDRVGSGPRIVAARNPEDEDFM
jgi:hypothetical protein